MSDKRTKHGNERSKSRRSKAYSFSYVTFTDGLAAWGEQKQKKLFNDPLQGHSSGCAWFPPDNQVPAMTLFLLCLPFSIHTSIYPIHLFSPHYWRACTHVESEPMLYGKKYIMVLLFFNIKGQRIRRYPPLLGLHTIPMVIREQLPLHFLHRLGWTMCLIWQNFT